MVVLLVPKGFSRSWMFHLDLPPSFFKHEEILSIFDNTAFAKCQQATYPKMCANFNFYRSSEDTRAFWLKMVKREQLSSNVAKGSRKMEPTGHLIFQTVHARTQTQFSTLDLTFLFSLFFLLSSFSSFLSFFFNETCYRIRLLHFLSVINVRECWNISTWESQTFHIHRFFIKIF